MSELIDKALADCDDTDVVIMGHNVLGETGRVFKKLFGDAKAIIIADENTWAVAGEQTKASFKANGVETVEPMIFPGRPTVYACYENIEKIRDHIRDLDGVIACSIGSKPRRFDLGGTVSGARGVRAQSTGGGVMRARSLTAGLGAAVVVTSLTF